MKLLCAEYNEARGETFVPVGDNALLRNNDDFYIPAFAAGEVSCVPQLVVRVCKIGKGVAERFASRYFEEVGLGIRFYAEGLRRELWEQHLSPAVAAAFDGSAALSPLDHLENLTSLPYALRVNGQEVFRDTIQALPNTPEQLIAKMSGYYMLKIGDLIYCGNTFRLSGIRPEDRLQAFLGEKCLLDFRVR